MTAFQVLLGVALWPFLSFWYHNFQEGPSLLRMVLYFRPLKVFLPISVALFLIGFPVFLYLLIFQLYISQTSLMVILFSLLTFLFGLVADTVSLLARR